MLFFLVGLGNKANIQVLCRSGDKYHNDFNSLLFGHWLALQSIATCEYESVKTCFSICDTVKLQYQK